MGDAIRRDRREGAAQRVHMDERSGHLGRLLYLTGACLVDAARGFEEQVLGLHADVIHIGHRGGQEFELPLAPGEKRHRSIDAGHVPGCEGRDTRRTGS